MYVLFDTQYHGDRNGFFKIPLNQKQLPHDIKSYRLRKQKQYDSMLNWSYARGYLFAFVLFAGLFFLPLLVLGLVAALIVGYRSYKAMANLSHGIKIFRSLMMLLAMAGTAVSAFILSTPIAATFSKIGALAALSAMPVVGQVLLALVATAVVALLVKALAKFISEQYWRHKIKQAVVVLDVDEKLSLSGREKYPLRPTKLIQRGVAYNRSDYVAALVEMRNRKNSKIKYLRMVPKSECHNLSMTYNRAIQEVSSGQYEAALFVKRRFSFEGQAVTPDYQLVMDAYQFAGVSDALKAKRNNFQKIYFSDIDESFAKLNTILVYDNTEYDMGSDGTSSKFLLRKICKIEHASYQYLVEINHPWSGGARYYLAASLWAAVSTSTDTILPDRILPSGGDCGNDPNHAPRKKPFVAIASPGEVASYMSFTHP